MVAALGFSMHDGILTAPSDLFADPFWNAVRDHIALKAMEMRRQGFFEPAMLPMSELEYGGIVARLRKLEQEFVVRKEAAKAPAGTE